MIHFKIERSTPIDNFETIFSSYGKISKYKFWEFEFYRYNWYWAEFEVSWKLIGSDHAGPEIGIGILGYYINFKIYDSRHWNTKLNDWTTYDE
jgi:hypothetical protein